MKINIVHEISPSEMKMTEEELLENFITSSKYNMFKVADKALSEVSWMNNRPKSCKLRYIAMLTKHLDAFLKDIDHNNDLNPEETES